MTSVTPLGRPQRASRTVFLRRALLDQPAMGALAPTSAVLARQMARLVPATPNLAVLELGAGTGAITTAITPRLGPGAVQIAVEQDPALHEVLVRVAPSAVLVRGDAADLPDHLARLGRGRVDLVLSSLPWSNFPAATQERVLTAVCAVLTDAGTFATIAYRPTRLNPASRRFHRLLRDRFAQVVPTATTWANLPPARLIVAHGPHAPVASREPTTSASVLAAVDVEDGERRSA